MVRVNVLMEVGIGFGFVASLLLVIFQDHKSMMQRRLMFSDPTTVEFKTKPSYSKLIISRLNNNETETELSSKFPFPLHFSTYSNDRMRNTRERLLREAQRTGWFTSTYAFTPLDLPDRFTQEYHDILNMSRGGGYWIWRFAVLDLMIDRIPEGDFFVFLDAGCAINPYAKHRLLLWLHKLSVSEYDEIGFKMHYKEYQWTTNHLFEAFEIPKNSDLRYSGQLYGGILIMRNGPHLRRILQSIYQVLAKDPYLITDMYNREAKILEREFRENRHDQSIHSLARKVHGSLEINYKELVGDKSPFPNNKFRDMSWEQVEEMEEQQKKDPHVLNDPSWRDCWRMILNKGMKC